MELTNNSISTVTKRPDLEKLKFVLNGLVYMSTYRKCYTRPKILSCILVSLPSLTQQINNYWLM
jgi:hypothetical protein